MFVVFVRITRRHKRAHSWVAYARFMKCGYVPPENFGELVAFDGILRCPDFVRHWIIYARYGKNVYAPPMNHASIICRFR